MFAMNSLFSCDNVDENWIISFYSILHFVSAFIVITHSPICNIDQINTLS